jgi:flagellar hook-associated protein 1 FlgK
MDSGDYQITTKDHRLLVLNDTAMELSASTATPAIGGSLAAELEIRDVYVPKYAATLDQLAYEIAQHVNSIHATGYDLDGNTNIDFFNPLASATDAARLISLSADIASDARRIAASSQASGNDNGTAVALGNLLSSPVFSGGSVTDQYGAMIFMVGSDVSGAQAGLDEQEAILVQLENRRQSLSGVSIDEESLQITQFPRAYEASAQLIKVVDELLQTTIAMLP